VCKIVHDISSGRILCAYVCARACVFVHVPNTMAMGLTGRSTLSNLSVAWLIE